MQATEAVIPRKISARSTDTPPPRGYACFGGVFDPIHNGHLRMARAALGALPIDKVVFIPAGAPPHKKSGTGATPEERLQMLQLGVRGFHHFSVDPREIHRSGPSYSILTLQELSREHPGEPIYFLLGSDNISQFKNWQQAEEILRICTLVIIPRPGSESYFTQSDLPWVSTSEIEHLNSLVLHADPIEISSSAIRKKISASEDVTSLLPAAVMHYIHEQKLYGIKTLPQH